MQLRQHEQPDHKPNIFIMGGDLQEIVSKLTSIYDKKYPHVEYYDSPLGHVNFIITPESITIATLTKQIICQHIDEQNADFQFDSFEVHAYIDELKKAAKKLKKTCSYILSFADDHIHISNDQNNTVADIGLVSLNIKTLEMIYQVTPKDFDF